jgi:hypothetical protein
MASHVSDLMAGERSYIRRNPKLEDSAAVWQ